MKKIITTTIAAGLVASAAVADVSVTLDFASAYVFRGVTLNDGAVFQPGIEVSGFGLAEEYGSVSAGAWGNWDFDNYNGGGQKDTFSETDWYASYSLPSFVENLDLFIGYCEYGYGAGSADKEANIGAGYEIAGIGLGVTYYQGVGGLIGTSSYLEFAAGYGYDFTEELSGSLDARIGFADQDGGESGFQDYDLGASLGYVLSESWSVGASIMYVGQGDDKVLPDGVGAYDVDFVGMFGLACEM
ncbi:hypothetical protein P4C99_12115 [Pontiellaceae bacterium B1224]|nr:hypothetical protein [Pontiellaceae bacterium B1224]